MEVGVEAEGSAEELVGKMRLVVAALLAAASAGNAPTQEIQPFAPADQAGLDKIPSDLAGWVRQAFLAAAVVAADVPAAAAVAGEAVAAFVAG